MTQRYCGSESHSWGSRPLPSSAFSSLYFCPLLFSFLTVYHARIIPCRQHPWSNLHRHGSLVYVRLTVCNTLLQELIKPDRRSSVYGVTWLQVYSYYNSHCSRDRWPLKSFVSSGSPRAMSWDLNKAFAGRFFDVYIFEASLFNT